VLNDKKEITSLDFLFDFENIMSILERYKLRTQRNYLTAVLVALGVYDTPLYNELREKYRNTLGQLTTAMNTEIELHVKTQSQSENWSTLKELKKNVLNTYKRNVKRAHLSTGTPEPTAADIFLYQEYLVASLYLLRPPVRLDYANMHIIRSREDIKANENYLLIDSDRKKTFIFGAFKNVAIIGAQEQRVEAPINKIINVWLNHFNKTNSFLLNTRMTALSPNGLGKLIGKVFSTQNKHVTLNLLRHIWASENVNLEQTKHQKKVAAAMMHSPATQLEYVKV